MPGLGPCPLDKGAGLRDLSDVGRAGGEPEEALGADHAGPGAVGEGMEGQRLERPAGAVDKGADAVLLRLRHMVAEPVQLLVPGGMLMGALEREAAGGQSAQHQRAHHRRRPGYHLDAVAG